MSTTILAATPVTSGASVEVSGQAYAMDAVVLCQAAVAAGVSLTAPCMVTLYLSNDGGVTYCPADTRTFGQLATSSFTTFDLSVYAGRTLSSGQYLRSLTGALVQAPSGSLPREFKPPWTHYLLDFEGNTGGTVSVSASSDSGSSVPTVTATDLLDAAFSSDQGSLLFRDDTAWVALAPGTATQVLTSGGAAADITWEDAAAGSSIGDNSMLANISGSAGVPTEHTVSEVLDEIIGSTQGILASRGTSLWVPATALTIGSSDEIINPAITSPASPVQGSRWFSSVSHSWRGCRAVNGANQLIESSGGSIYQCGACDAVANSTSLLTLLGNPVSSRGSLIIPANSINTGQSLQFRIWAKWSATATPTLLLKLLLGATAVGTTPAVALSALTNMTFTHNNMPTIAFATIGATGNVYVTGTCQAYTTGSAATSFSLTADAAGGIGAITVDTTTDLTIGLQAQWSAASASNTLQVLNFEVILNG